MSETYPSTGNNYQFGVYEIRIKGHLDDQWADWFGGLTITLEDNGDTLLTGPVVDQAALYGLLKKVRDLGMPLRSVMEVEAKRNPQMKDFLKTGGFDTVEKNAQPTQPPSTG